MSNLGNFKTKVDENGRVCTRCKQYKTWDNFGFMAAGTNMHAAMCYQCNNARVKPKDKVIARYCREHCLTIPEVEKLLEVTHCEICAVELTKGVLKPTLFSVDHNHKTGRVRGVLCQSCNAGLGMFKDDITIMLKAIKYLQER